MNARVGSQDPLHRSQIHESGQLHTTGEARYVDDLATGAGALVCCAVISPHAHARILQRAVGTALEVPGVEAVLFAADVPGENRIGPIIHDEPLLAEEEVSHVGQVVALVVGRDYDACREGVARVEVTYETQPALLSLSDAIAAGSFLTEPHVIACGDVETALQGAAVRIDGEVSNGAQDHFYLETQAALAVPGEDGTMVVHSSTQHPTECQKMVARALDLRAHEVVCEVPRMGGAFGGKESQATNWAVLAALGAHRMGRPVKFWLDRDADMCLTGKRHPFWSRYRAGFDESGRITALKVEIFSDGGAVLDLSGAIMDRALFHLTNAYHVPHVHFTGRVCRTNLVSNTAFRGFGGPQGMLVIEDALNRYAEHVGQDPAEVRHRCFYGPPPRDRTPYGQEIGQPRLEQVYEGLMASSNYASRRKAMVRFNASSRFVKRGIGFQPVKFGISFTASMLNQAGALVLVFADGSVQINHGGTEMGQGLHTKMAVVAAHALGVGVDSVRVMTTSTDKVPNTSATAASSGSDLNGQAIRRACLDIRSRLAVVAGVLLDVPAEDVVFSDDQVWPDAHPERSITMAEVASRAWFDQVSLSATGFYATPGIAYDRAAGRGTPFHYFAYGGCVTEVEVNGLTGEFRVIRADILHDVGDSLVPNVDQGQVEGGYIQGLGWLTCEEVLFDDEGRLITHSPSTYKIPAVGDAPLDFRVQFLDHAPQPGVIHGSKAVGEPPFMLAISVVTALRHAIGAYGSGPISLSIPCTPEAVLRAIESRGQPT